MAKKPSLMERLRAKKRAQATPEFAVVWYDDEAEWAKVKAIATDAETLLSSYDQWRAMVETSLSQYLQVGMALRKVSVKADELAQYCQAENLPCNNQTRAQFVTKLANESLKAP